MGNIEKNNNKNLIKKCYFITKNNDLKIKYLANKHGYSEGLTLNKILDNIKII